MASPGRRRRTVWVQSGESRSHLTSLGSPADLPPAGCRGARRTRDRQAPRFCGCLACGSLATTPFLWSSERYVSMSGVLLVPCQISNWTLSGSCCFFNGPSREYVLSEWGRPRERELVNSCNLGKKALCAQKKAAARPIGNHDSRMNQMRRDRYECCRSPVGDASSFISSGPIENRFCWGSARMNIRKSNRTKT